MSSLDVVVVQSDEIKALRSIFGKEFKLLRPKNLKKKYEPPLISILINVDSSNVDSKISLKILFDCPNNYPLDSPKFVITDVSNAPVDVTDHLVNTLNEKSVSLRGSQMIYNLVEEARNILVKYFEPPRKHETVTNEPMKTICEDEILQTENKQSELRLQYLRQRRNSARNENKKEKRFEKCYHSYKNDTLQFENRNDKSNNYLVNKGLCDGQHRIKTINSSLQLMINSFDGFNCQNGTSVKIQQISFQNLKRKHVDHLKSNWLFKLEEDFSLLYKLNHPNLLTYYGFRSQIYEKTIRKKKHFDFVLQYLTSNNGGMKLSTLCEYDKNSESSITNELKTSLPISKIRKYLKSTLDAVSYLHEKNITFIKINLDSIIVDKDMQLKICHFFIWKRFEELKEQLKEQDDTNEKNLDRAAISAIKKGSKRHDLMKLGKLAKQLYFFGLSEAEIDESDMPPDLIDFILCCESNSDDLKLHPFLCCENSYRKVNQNSSSINSTQDLSPWKLFETSSRIPKEFDLICKLGEGAFGDVVKVKNIYDNQYYAIKRVRLNAIKKKAARTMKEVQLLSSLNHENIVRYYASWSEEIKMNGNQTVGSQRHYESSSTRNNMSTAKSIIKPDTNDSVLMDLQDQRNSFIFSANFNYSQIDHHSRHFDLESYSESDTESDSDSDSDSDSQLNKNIEYQQQTVDICFVGDDENDDENDQKNNKESIKDLSEKLKTIHIKSGYANDCSKNKNSHSNKNKIEKYLMIQMELCEGQWNTLQKYIDDQKLYLHEKLIWRFIREIVSGLEHIHSKNMIHRDLKPHNIFLDCHKRIKIGDLGLAMNINQKVEPLNQSTVDNGSNDIEGGPVGTWMYICPEMMNHISYTDKADMYSLGIIIFEMCHKPFSTGSERNHVLGNLRLPEIIFPNEKHFKMKSSFEQLIKSLLNHDAAFRPSASELLRSNIIPPPEGKEMELRNFLVEVTKNSSSSLYKLMLKELFNQLSVEIGRYELPLLHQSPFRFYLSNTKPHLLRNLRNHFSSQIDQGDYFFFTMKRLVIRLIESVFISHGAVEFMAPLLSPKINKTESGLFSLLDTEGVVVNLPNNLRISFAHFLVINNICSCKRYGIGPIYQQQEYRRDHPREMIEAAFDVVTDYYNSNKIIEVVCVLHQVFKKCFNPEQVSITLVINHTDIFFAVMNYYKIPAELHQRILAPSDDMVTSNIEFLDSDQFKKSTNLSDKQMSHIKAILTFNNGRLEDLEKHFKIFQNRGHDCSIFDSINKALNELRSIEEKLQNSQESLSFSINIRPNFVPIESIYRGFVYQSIVKVQDKLLDFVKPSSDKNIKLTVKYLRSPKVISSGGEYSNYLIKSHRPFVGESGDFQKFVSAIGASFDVSTILQCMHSIELLIPFYNGEIEHHTEYIMNSAVNVVVQYDTENDIIIRDLMTELWTANISAELYDKDEHGEEYVFNQRIHFFVKFPCKYDDKSNTDFRILVKKNDCKGVGLEQISNVDIKKPSHVVDIILKELKKTKGNLFTRLEKEQPHLYQRQASDSLSNDSYVEFESKKPTYLKTDSNTFRYVYKFITGKEGKLNSQAEYTVSYFIESTKQMQWLSQKFPNLEMYQIQLIRKLNSQLTNINKWLQGKFPNPLYSLICELSYSKCLSLVEEVSIKSLKDKNALTKLFSEIESSKNYQSNVEKQWKDVLSRIWEALQNTVKEKIFRVVIFSQIDENFVVLEIK